MRWLLSANCILLACSAVVLATNLSTVSESVRPKRDLNFWKNLIAAKLGLVEAKPPLQQDENVKILRIPGFENILVRAVPRVTVVETPTPIEPVPEKIVEVDSTMALLGAYLGTKTPEETLFALQRVKGLLQSGILKAREEVIELMPPKPPVYVFPQTIKKTVNCPEPRPVVPVFQKMPLVPIPYMPVPALRPLPVPVMKPLPFPHTIIDEITPIEVVPTEYSYKQLNGGKVTSYISRGGDEVVVTQTDQPPPPPPRYVIDRIQKMIYGLPLGVTQVRTVLPPVTPYYFRKPFIDIPVVQGPYVQQDEIISGPSSVNVKVHDANKKLYHGSVNIFAGTRVMKKPFTSTLIQEEVTVPEFKPPVPLNVPAAPILVETTETEDNEKFSYKHVRGDGTLNTYSGTTMMREPFTSVAFEHVSQLPPPPPQIVHRIEEAAAKAPKSMWGYSFKIANGAGVFENTNKDKIYYSRLTSGGDKQGFPVVPHPLSSNSDEERKPHNNMYVIDENSTNGDKEVNEKDELGNPFLSTKINGAVEVSTDSPGPSSSEGQKDASTTTEFTPIKMIPRLPTPISGENKETGHSKITGGAKYSYTLVKNDGSLKIGGNPDESQGTTVTDELPSKKEDGSGTFSYTQINGAKMTTVSKENVKGSVLVTERIKNIPKLPSAIIDVIQPMPKPVEVAIEVAEKHPAVVFPKPIISSYMYKQINHNNPKPFTVVKVEDVPKIELPENRGDVHVKVNMHEHVRADGTRYPCSEVHLIPVDPAAAIPIAPIPMIPTAEIIPTVPSGLLYVPTETVDVSPRNKCYSVKGPLCKQGKKPPAHFSYTQVSSQKDSTDPDLKLTTTTEKPLSLSLNPIVVAPEVSNYSYTQTNSNGASVSIKGNKDNTVSVKVEDSNGKSYATQRGDIPDALA